MLSYLSARSPVPPTSLRTLSVEQRLPNNARKRRSRPSTCKLREQRRRRRVPRVHRSRNPSSTTARRHGLDADKKEGRTLLRHSPTRNESASIKLLQMNERVRQDVESISKQKQEFQGRHMDNLVETIREQRIRRDGVVPFDDAADAIEDGHDASHYLCHERDAVRDSMQKRRVPFLNLVSRPVSYHSTGGGESQGASDVKLSPLDFDSIRDRWKPFSNAILRGSTRFSPVLTGRKQSIWVKCTRRPSSARLLSTTGERSTISMHREAIGKHDLTTHGTTHEPDTTMVSSQRDSGRDAKGQESISYSTLAEADRGRSQSSVVPYLNTHDIVKTKDNKIISSQGHQKLSERDSFGSYLQYPPLYLSDAAFNNFPVKMLMQRRQRFSADRCEGDEVISTL